MKIDYQVGIVGAGFGGLIAALELVKAGISSFVIFERAAEPGGTWRDNTYPGCACDVRSHLYSIAGQQNPDWSASFSSQPEILQYLKDVIAKNDLQKYIRYNTEITAMRFVEDAGCWEISDGNNQTCMVKMMILATGPYNHPNMPDFAGGEIFKGAKFHSFNWDHSVDLAGKRIAVIGTGASAIQIVPQLAPIAAQLTVFQRTPAWITSRKNKSTSRFAKWLFRKMPFTQKLMRGIIYNSDEFVGRGFIGDEVLNSVVKYLALKKLKNEVNDPATRRKLTPSYKIGCKRVLVSDDFYPSFNLPNVTLVNNSVTALTENAVLAENGKTYEADVVVFASGFITADFYKYINITGLNGRVLTDEWDKHGAEAFRGITVSGYPNMAFILGPNTGLGHTSVVHMMESQMHYVMQYIGQLGKMDANDFLDVKPAVQQAYNEALQAGFKNTVWASGCQSFYLNKNGKNTTLYPRLSRHYRKKTKRFEAADFI